MDHCCYFIKHTITIELSYDIYIFFRKPPPPPFKHLPPPYPHYEALKSCALFCITKCTEQINILVDAYE